MIKIVKEPKFKKDKIVYIRRKGIIKNLGINKEFFILNRPYVISDVAKYQQGENIHWCILVDGSTQYVHEEQFKSCCW